jgi:hypothetical protein
VTGANGVLDRQASQETIRPAKTLAGLSPKAYDVLGNMNALGSAATAFLEASDSTSQS